MRRFSLYRRKKVWYCQFYNEKTGKYFHGISTGQKNRDAALLVVSEWLREGVERPGKVKKELDEVIFLDTILDLIRRANFTHHDAERIIDLLKEKDLIGAGVDFISFLEEFWTFDKSAYVKEKLAHGQKITKNHCYLMLLQVSNYWKPFFEGKKLQEINKIDLKEFSATLPEKGLSPKTLNNILSAGEVPLKWAYKNDLILKNPAEGIMRFSGKSTKRGILTEKEVKKILYEMTWKDERGRVGNLLAAGTGLRAGEILGLRVQDIGKDRLFIRHSWSERDRLKGTKTYEERAIPLHVALRSELLSLAGKNPYGTGSGMFVFWSLDDPDRPCSHRPLRDGLKDALCRMKAGKDNLNKDEKVMAWEYWKSRGIVFHSWRHFYASRLADRLDQRTAMIGTGHKTGAVFQAYTDHESTEHFEKLSQAMGEILPFPKVGEEK